MPTIRRYRNRYPMARKQEIHVNRHSSSEVTISWGNLYRGQQRVVGYQLHIRNLAERETTVLSYSPSATSVKQDVLPGCRYQVKVVVLADSERTLKTASCKFTSAYTKPELRRLHEKACQYNDNADMMVARWLYRNKSEEYFDNISHNQEGVMRKERKDNGGDPCCAINGRLFGLFFMANVSLQTGQPPAQSPFGPKRFNLEANFLMERRRLKLYFADFYCMNKKRNHYVTLVLTYEGSRADLFCRKLIELDIHNNPFLCLDGRNVRVSTKVWVEVFYTAYLNINHLLASKVARFTKTEVTPPGCSTPGGLKKMPDCEVCNL